MLQSARQVWGERAGAHRSAGARTDDSLPDTAHNTTTDENVFHPERSRDANQAKKLRGGASVGGWEEKQTRAHSHSQGALVSAWRLFLTAPRSTALIVLPATLRAVLVRGSPRENHRDEIH
jgi:hypothetical protein